MKNKLWLKKRNTATNEDNQDTQLKGLINYHSFLEKNKKIKNNHE